MRDSILANCDLPRVAVALAEALRGLSLGDPEGLLGRMRDPLAREQGP